MSNQVVSALERAAKQIVHALGEGASKAEHRLLHETADNLETSAKKHIEHDAKAAKDLEAAAKPVRSPTVPGTGAPEASPIHHEPTRGDTSEIPTVPTGGVSAETKARITAMEKGIRPDPSEYLSPEYIDQHLRKFDGGAARFMPESNLQKYGIAQRDGTSFVMPKNEADALLAASEGDPRAMERGLGLPEGFLDSHKVVRIDIPNPREYGLRVPSGNEAGANDQWIPGGLLPDGGSEAVVDGSNIPSDGYDVKSLPRGRDHK